MTNHRTRLADLEREFAPPFRIAYDDLRFRGRWSGDDRTDAALVQLLAFLARARLQTVGGTWCDAEAEPIDRQQLVAEMQARADLCDRCGSDDRAERDAARTELAQQLVTEWHAQVAAIAERTGRSFDDVLADPHGATVLPHQRQDGTGEPA